MIFLFLLSIFSYFCAVISVTARHWPYTSSFRFYAESRVIEKLHLF